MLNLNIKREREELESTAVQGQTGEKTQEKDTNLYIYW